jgi:hypothetical protein
VDCHPEGKILQFVIVIADKWAEGQSPCKQQPQGTVQQPCRAANVMEEKKTNIWLTWILPSVLLIACLYIIVLLIGTRFRSLISTKCGMGHQNRNTVI